MLTEFEAKALVDLTTNIYESVCYNLELDPNLVRRMYLLPDKHKDTIEQIGKAYIKNICKLDERTLELILMAHEQGFTKRRADTLHAIQGELVERGLLDEGEV